MRGELQYRKEHGSHFYPSVVINRVTYRGNLVAEEVFKAICAGFETRPEECGKIEVERGNAVTHRFLFLIFGGIIVVMLLAICGIRRYMKREMQSEMNTAVNSAVSQYFALSQNKN